MEKEQILSDEILKARRYPSSNKTRKEWLCDRCGATVAKGGYIEHSHSAKMTFLIELCLPCVEILKN